MRTRLWFAENGSILLILSVLVLFCTKTLFNIPLTIMGLIVLYRFITKRVASDDDRLRLLVLLFLCLWLPMLIAFVDAVNMTRTVSTVFFYLRYFLAGVYILQEINSTDRLKKLFIGIFIVVTVWWGDALLQYILGRNIFGQPYDPDKGLAGMFYPKVRLPHLLAVVTPVYFEFVRRYHSRFRWLWLTLPPLFLVLLLGEKRTAWMMLMVAVLAYIACLLFSKRLQASKLVLGVLIIIAIVSATMLNDSFRQRVHETLGLFSADVEMVDEATARRLSLWEIGVDIITDNWINGIGPRGFRYVDTEYADEDNFWIQGDRHGQTHPHLFIMEILIETGITGFIGYLLFFIVLVGAVRSRMNSPCVLPWIASIFVVVFPLNAHLAFYGSYWSSVVWWFIPVGIAALYHDRHPG